MRDIEKEFEDKKIDINNIEVPDDLEYRLRSVLKSAEKSQSKIQIRGSWVMRHKAMVAVLAFVLFFGIYNYDVFAYYSKQILGYEEITYGSIKELNEAGMCQEIGRSYIFKNGVEVILDGVIMDENKLIAMYRVRGEDPEKLQRLGGLRINGAFKTYRPSSGRGKSTEDEKEFAWVQEFQAPLPFDRQLTFSVISTADDISRGEVGNIQFKLDMNKAAKRMLKLNLNEYIEFEGTKYQFTSISATAMSVVIEGKIEIGSEKDKEAFYPSPTSDLSSMRYVEVELWQTYLKDNKEITEKVQGGMKSVGLVGKIKSFQCSFDGLKSGFKKLELNLLKLSDMRILDKAVYVNTGTKNLNVTDRDEELVVKQVVIEDGKTIVIFEGEKDVAFTTALFIGDKQAKAISESSKMITVNGTERLEKIYSFEGSSNDMKLMFKAISHETYINKQITLYEEK